jgi:CMP-N,N'-diacetyllegionaminic acid synthase
MAVIALIPARGGSKAIPRKNLAPLGGRPLLAYTADAVRASRTIDRAILSTDDAEIAAAGRGLGIEVPFLRPPELSGDDVPMLSVLVHALDWLERDSADPVEALVLLQPTSPFREARHIDEAVALFRERSADSVVSVIEVPHQFTPSSLMQAKEGRLARYLEGDAAPTRRQDKERLWARNGPAVLVLRPAATLRRDQLYTAGTYGYPMDRASSLDIDGPDDLQLAELMLQARRGGSHAQ